jgi:hypothetical protein
LGDVNVTWEDNVKDMLHECKRTQRIYVPAKGQIPVTVPRVNGRTTENLGPIISGGYLTMRLAISLPKKN